MMQIEYGPTDVETFWSRVDKKGPVPEHRPELGPCWIWTRAKAVSGGYGVFGPSWKRVYRAHVFAWTVTSGPVPSGLRVLHHCDNPPCVRPDHLFVGTQKANVDDCVEKGRFKSVTGPRGQTHHSAKLSEDTVRAIRQRAGDGEQHSRLAREYGVTQTAVYNIARGKTWKHVR